MVLRGRAGENVLPDLDSREVNAGTAAQSTARSIAQLTASLLETLVEALFEPLRHQYRQTQQKAAEEPQVHPRQQQVVAQIVEVRYATFVGAEIAHRCFDPDGPHALPAQTHRCFRIEVEAPHPYMAAHHFTQRL